MSAQNDLFDRELLRQRRARFAGALPDHDFLLRRAAEDIAGRVGAVLREFPLALDIGAQNGLLGRELRKLPSVGQVISADHCLPAIAQADPLRVICEEEQLPFADRCADLIVSNLALHLVNDLPGALIQIRHALKADGLFMGALLGGETLTELRQALVEAEAETTGGASPRIAPFADVRDCGALLQRAEFAMPVSDSDLVEVTYASPIDLMREARAMGGGNILRARSRQPLRRATLVRAVEIYCERFPAGGGRVRATFEIIHLTGWAPGPGQPKPLRPGSAKTRLADALGVEEQSAGERANPKK